MRSDGADRAAHPEAWFLLVGSGYVLFSSAVGVFAMQVEGYDWGSSVPLGDSSVRVTIAVEGIARWERRLAASSDDDLDDFDDDDFDDEFDDDFEEEWDDLLEDEDDFDSGLKGTPDEDAEAFQSDMDD